MNYRQLGQDSLGAEVIVDPDSPMGLMIADQAPSDTPDPLEMLILAEEQLQAELYYVRIISLFLYIIILFAKVFVVLTAKGAG